jgi:hypothetical protein
MKKMNRLFPSGSTLALVILLAAEMLPGQTFLTGAMEFSCNSSGSPEGGNIWNTLSGESKCNIFLSSGPGLANPFINGPSDALADISIPLSPGVNRFRIFGGSGLSVSFHAINLFFNGDNSIPRISALGLTQSTALPSGFAANGNAVTLALDGLAVTPGANSLSFQDGDRLITLTEYSWADPAVFSLDRVYAPTGNPGEVGTDGTLDWIGQMALTVTPIPEPASAALMLLAWGALRLAKTRTK